MKPRRPASGEHPARQGNVQENKRVVRRMFRALSRGDVEGFLSPLAEGVRFRLIGTTKFSGTHLGRQAFIDRVLAPLGEAIEPGLTITVDDLIAEGDRVVSLSRGHARTKDGRPYENAYAHVFRITRGHVVEVVEYFDTELAAKTFGP